MACDVTKFQPLIGSLPIEEARCLLHCIRTPNDDVPIMLKLHAGHNLIGYALGVATPNDTFVAALAKTLDNCVTPHATTRSLVADSRGLVDWLDLAKTVLAFIQALMKDPFWGVAQ